MSRAFVPPASVGCRWSASVARAWPHQWHGGSSASRRARFFLNSAWLRCLLFALVGMVTPALASLGWADAARSRLVLGFHACGPCRVRFLCVGLLMVCLCDRRACSRGLCVLDGHERKPSEVMPAHGVASCPFPIACLKRLFTFSPVALPKPFRVSCFGARPSTRVPACSRPPHATGVRP